MGRQDLRADRSGRMVNLDEEVVTQWAEDVAKILVKLGWQRDPDVA